MRVPVTDSPSLALEFPCSFITAWGARVFPTSRKYNHFILTCPHPDRYRIDAYTCGRCGTESLWEAK